jgi:hypothetical protein
VPYRGDAPAVQDMMAGQIDMMIEPSSNFTAQVNELPSTIKEWQPVISRYLDDIRTGKRTVLV